MSVGVVAFNGGHGVVDELADGGLWGVGSKVMPACFWRYPEDVVGAVLVAVLWVGAVGSLRFELGVFSFEGVGDVLEEDEAEDDVFVLGGVHVVAEGVGGGPELGFEV